MERAYDYARQRSLPKRRVVSLGLPPCHTVCGLSKCVKGELESVAEPAVAEGLVTNYHWTPNSVEALLNNPNIRSCNQNPEEAVTKVQRSFAVIFNGEISK